MLLGADCDEVPSQADDDVDVDNALEMASDVLRSETLRKLEDLKDARDTVRNMATIRQILAQFRKENPNVQHVEVHFSISFRPLVLNDRKRPKACSFSRLTLGHLDNMGIIRNRPADFADFTQNAKEVFDFRLETFQNRSLSEVFPPFWQLLRILSNF